MFYAGDAVLPTPSSGIFRNCTQVPSDANVMLIGSRAFTDTSGSSRSVQQYGGVSASAQGTHFDGHDDYVTIATFPFRSIPSSTSLGSLLAPNPEFTGFCCSEIIFLPFSRTIQQVRLIKGTR